jgi:hypothetical protein
MATWPADMATSMTELVRLVAKLQEENRNLAGQLGYTQAKLQEAQLALAAPVTSTMPEIATGSPSDNGAVEPTDRRPNSQRHGPGGPSGVE